LAESAAYAAIGSRLKIEPPNLYTAWPPGLQYAVSADGVTWGSWTDVDYYEAVDITYPGYFKIKTTAAAIPKAYNFKTEAEATSILLDTVLVGEVATT